MAVIISSGLILSAASAAIPLSHPRILWDDILRRGTITSSSAAAGFDEANAANGLTWDYWRPTEMPAWLQVDLPAAEPVDYALLAAHSLGSEGVSAKPQYWSGSEWIDLGGETQPGDDKVLVWLFEPVTADRFRFLHTSSDPENLASIGVAMMGKALAMQRGVPLNHQPIEMAKSTKVFPQISEGGQLLGRTITREGVSGRIEFRYLEAAWLRANFEPFMESARTRPFGWIQSPTSYPAEAALLWTPAGEEDIRPEHADLPDRMNVSFDVEGSVQ